MSTPTPSERQESGIEKSAKVSEFVEHVDEHHTAPPPQARTTWKMVCFGFYIALCAFTFGFDAGYGGTVLAMPPFAKAFGKCVTIHGKTHCAVSATRQSVGTVYQLWASVGAILAAIMTKWIGRRSCLQVGCVWVVIGAAGMLGTTGNYGAYVVCHCIEAVGLGHFFSMAPIYGVECVTPQKRGMLISLYAVGASLGSLIISAVCLRTSTITNNWAWKTLIVIQIPLAVIYGLGLMMFSESPRWLMLQGREEAARKSFASFYCLDPSSPIITEQLDQVRTAIEFERSISATTHWTAIFDRQNRRRTLIACAVTATASFSGLWLIAPYAALFLRGLGYTNPFLINVIIGVCLFSGTTISPFVLEYLGRRTTMLVGYSAMAACMLIFSAVSTGLGASNPTARSVLVAFICMWGISFGSTIGSTQWVASSEMHSVRLRTYGQVSAAVVSSVTSFAASFWTPYMINAQYGNMGTNVGYFYFGLNVVSIIIMFFMLPETGRLSLEAIDDIFTSRTPAWKTSLKQNKLASKSE